MFNLGLKDSEILHCEIGENNFWNNTRESYIFEL